MIIKTLIVGLGQIGMGYDLHLDQSSYILTHAKAFGLNPRFNLLAGVDVDKARREIFTDRFKKPAFSTIKEACLQNKPELIIISAPTPMHYEMLAQSLSFATPRYILCEKPLSYDVDEARGMINLCDSNGAKLFVNYMRRSDPGVIEVKRQIDLGKIEMPFKAVGWYTKGILHNGSHLINLMEYWFGNIINIKIINPGSICRVLDAEPDLEMVFEQGSFYFFSLSSENYAHHEIEIMAKNGRLLYQDGGRSIVWQSAEKSDIFNGYTSISNESIQIKSGMNFFQNNVANEIANFAEGVHFNLCSSAEALCSIEKIIGALGHE